MTIRNATREQIDKALADVNKMFGGNVTYNRKPEPTNKSGLSHRLTLRVSNSSGPGHRCGQHNRRKMVAACWHVHGFFFDALPKEAEIIAGGLKIRPGDRWNDRNIGSQMFPMYYSEACDCQ